MSAENLGCKVPVKVGFKPLSIHDYAMLNRYASQVSALPLPVRPRFIGRVELPPVDSATEYGSGYGDAT